MLYRNKNAFNYICRVTRGNHAVVVYNTRSYNPVGMEFIIDFKMWIPITFNEYLKKL